MGIFLNSLFLIVYMVISGWGVDRRFDSFVKYIGDVAGNATEERPVYVDVGMKVEGTAGVLRANVIGKGRAYSAIVHNAGSGEHRKVYVDDFQRSLTLGIREEGVSATINEKTGRISVFHR